MRLRTLSHSRRTKLRDLAIHRQTILPEEAALHCKIAGIDQALNNLQTLDKVAPDISVIDLVAVLLEEREQLIRRLERVPASAPQLHP